MSITKTIFVLCLFVIACGSLPAQTTSSQSELASKIETAIKSQEPAWEFSPTPRDARANSTVCHWKSGPEQIDIHVFVTDSAEAAVGKLNEFAQQVPIAPKERLKTLGDEALMYQGVNTKACMILFRRDNIVIHLNGSSVADAKRFAKHLDDLFRNSKNE